MLSIFLGSMNCFFHIAQNCFLTTIKHHVAWRGKSSKRTSDSSRDSYVLFADIIWWYRFHKIVCWYRFHKIVWWFYFNEISNCCVFANLPYIPTSPFTNFGDFCQAPRLLHPSHLLFWPKFASLPVYSTLPFYLKLKSMLFSRNTWIWIFVQLVLWMG